MYSLLLILSGEHQTLPVAEVKATLEAESFNFRLREFEQPILIIEVDNQEVHKILEKRLAMTLEGIALLFKCEADIKGVENSLKDIDLSFLEGKTIAVRVTKKIRRDDIKSIDLERKIGAMILNKTKNVKVNLRSPDIVLRGVLTSSFYFGVRKFQVDRGTYDLRRPRYRPFFHPGSLEPRVCRVFVNLARTKKGSTFLDPFNGTGGFSIEASMIGCQVIGLDLDDDMCHGALRNMKALKCEYVGMVRGDARKLPMMRESIDSIATDPPYGRATSLKKILLKELLQDFLNQAEEILKKGGYLCFAHPSWLTDFSIPSRMIIVEQHAMKVHRSLTRKITVLRRL
ncbi:MAG: THUMP domain-containing protein [Candidatus Nezhaarchaeales archaeon]